MSGHGGALLFAAWSDTPFHAIVIRASDSVPLALADFRLTPHTRG